MRWRSCDAVENAERGAPAALVNHVYLVCVSGVELFHDLDNILVTLGTSSSIDSIVEVAIINMDLVRIYPNNWTCYREPK
jgi:hypothetical protein